MNNYKIATYLKRKNTKITEKCSKCGIELKYIRFRKLNAVNIEDMAIEKENGAVLLCPLCWYKYNEFLRNNESYTLRASHDFNINTVDYMRTHGMMDDENIFRISSEQRSEQVEYAGCEITEEEKRYIANDVLVVKEAMDDETFQNFIRTKE